MKKAFLDNVLGLAPVTNHPERNPENQPGVAIEQDFQAGGIVPLQAGHYFVITRYAESWEFCWGRGSLLAPGQGNGKRESASLRRSTHGLIPSGRPVGDAVTIRPWHRRTPPTKPRWFQDNTPTYRRKRRFFDAG